MGMQKNEAKGPLVTNTYIPKQATPIPKDKNAKSAGKIKILAQRGAIGFIITGEAFSIFSIFNLNKLKIKV